MPRAKPQTRTAPSKQPVTTSELTVGWHRAAYTYCGCGRIRWFTEAIALRGVRGVPTADSAPPPPTACRTCHTLHTAHESDSNSRQNAARGAFGMRQATRKQQLRGAGSVPRSRVGGGGHNVVALARPVHVVHEPVVAQIGSNEAATRDLHRNAREIWRTASLCFDTIIVYSTEQLGSCTRIVVSVHS